MFIRKILVNKSSQGSFKEQHVWQIKMEKQFIA